MSATDVPDVVHAVPGRLRVRLRGWEGNRPGDVVARLQRLPGVLDATASAATGNALLRYDPRVTGVDELLAGIGGASAGDQRSEEPPAEAPAAEQDPRLAPLRWDAVRTRRARIAVRGLDRDPRIARRLAERLRARPGVRRVEASPLTGRVLVEFSNGPVDLEDVLADITDVELPEEPGEDRPAHPLDRAPLIQSSARLVGAAAGLTLLGVRKLRGARDEPPGWAVGAAAVVGVVEGLPPVRRRLEAALGHDGAQFALGAASILTLTLSETPLGLLVTGITALRLVTEVRARRAAWRDYEDRLADAASADPGETIRLEAGERAPLRGRIVEGAGTGTGRDGLPERLAPGAALEAGTRVFGGPFVVELLGGDSFDRPQRPRPPTPSRVQRYVETVSVASLGYAALTFLATRSLRRAVVALLLVNPRPALIGDEVAELGASARVLRAGVTVVRTRLDRAVDRLDTIVLDRPRVVTDGFELAGVFPIGGADPEELADVVAAVASAAASPWGSATGTRAPRPATDGRFDGVTAEATIDGRRYTLAALDPEDPAVARQRARGEQLLALRGPHGEVLAHVALRPRLAAGLPELVATARARGTELLLVAHDEPDTARAVARRGNLPLVVDAETLDVVRERQAAGARVALVADGAYAAEGFAAADLAIALTSGRSGRFPARADLLAPDLSAVAAIVDAGARRALAADVSIVASGASNLAGGVSMLRGAPGARRASLATYLATLAAVGAGWLLLRGGTRSRSVTARLVDPRPERWGRRSAAEALGDLDSAPGGLTSKVAARRLRPPRRPPTGAGPMMRALTVQLRSPLTVVLGASAALSVATGAFADVPIIAAVLVANAAIGAWQEHQANRAGEALGRLSAPTARVLRDGEERTAAANAVVPGDVLVLAPGDHVVADARLLDEEALEVDEAALTGESLPARKRADEGADATRVVLEGSDVVVGHGHAVVVAVGGGTRLGAIRAALALDEPAETPLSRRLGRLLAQSLPVILAGGLIVTVSGLLRRRPRMEQLALGASAAVAAVPEGLPLLAGVAEAAVARRLARRGAYVRHLTAVEALGRVDVACFDKTGTLTEGRPAVARVADVDGRGWRVEELPAEMREVLAAAAVAGPHPDAPDAQAHPTDGAVLRAASAAGVAEAAARPRKREAPFDPARGFHATEADGRVVVKGAAEVLVPRCVAARRGRAVVPLDDAGRAALLAVADRLASDGLRVLMVAEGPDGERVEDPRDLTALGFIGISDPLRPGVADAVRRCREAGVRLVMLTGDHPATARAIAGEAGLATAEPRVLTGEEFVLLDETELDERLEDADVIARITPLDKVRIVESLQRRGHTVAMTGDGVNDAPALRLADVGVAMGKGGTDVAREAADVVLADDDLAALVEALVEGRSFWRNMRHALALLLGGNLGELGLIAGASVLGRGSMLTTRQILSINLATDVLPALAVGMQEPEHRDLSALTREGAAALDAPLRDEILSRGFATAAPSVVASLLADLIGEPAATVAFASVVATQLAQTIDVGRAQGRLRRSVGLAVVIAGGLTAAAVAVPPLRAFLGLAPLGPAGGALILVASLGSTALARALRGADVSRGGRAAAGSGPERPPTARAAALSPA